MSLLNHVFVCFSSKGRNNAKVHGSDLCFICGLEKSKKLNMQLYGDSDISLKGGTLLQCFVFLWHLLQLLISIV